MTVITRQHSKHDVPNTFMPSKKAGIGFLPIDCATYVHFVVRVMHAAPYSIICKTHTFALISSAKDRAWRENCQKHVEGGGVSSFPGLGVILAVCHDCEAWLSSCVNCAAGLLERQLDCRLDQERHERMCMQAPDQGKFYGSCWLLFLSPQGTKNVPNHDFNCLKQKR